MTVPSPAPTLSWGQQRTHPRMGASCARLSQHHGCQPGAPRSIRLGARCAALAACPCPCCQGALPKCFPLHWAVSASHHPGNWVGNCAVPDLLTPEQRQSTQSCWLKNIRSTGVRRDREAKAACGIGGKEDPALETSVLWRRPNV